MLGGAVLLVAVLAGVLGYGRWRAVQLAREWQKRAGVTITHETNGFTYSQAIKGKTVFTLHAAKAVQHDDGKWTLKDAELTLYSRNSPRVDQIYGAEFEYDSKAGVARAVGEVHMDLQAPESLQTQRTPQKIRGREGRAPSAGHGAPGESLQTIHVRTSGLVYMRSLGVAATQEDVEFRYGGLEAHARGAEFDEGESIVHLLADVHVSGDMNGQDMDLRAAKADLDRSNNLASMAQPVVRSGGRTISAANGVLHLRRDGAPESVDASGGVQMVSGTEQVHGATLHVALNERSMPVSAVMDGGVTLADTSAARPLKGAAQRMEATFDAAGQPKVVTAIGGVSLASAASPGAGRPPLARTVTADRVALTLVALSEDATRRQVSELHAVGHARATAESMVATRAAASRKGRRKQATAKPSGDLLARKTTTLAGDDLRAVFAPGPDDPVLQRVFGAGHARLEQAVAGGEREASTADAMEIAFAAGAEGRLEVASATEMGHVAIRTEKPAAKAGVPASVTTAAADRTVYDGVAQRLTLTGGAQFRQAGVAVMANTIAADERSGDAVADGAVSTTLEGATPAAEPSHVISEHAMFVRGAQVAQFFGSEGHPARLWHGGSQVQAASIRMDSETKSLAARPAQGGTVQALFVGGGTPGSDAARGQTASVNTASRGARAGGVVRVNAARMDYTDRTHQAVFAGGVTMHAASGDVRAQRAVAFFAPKSTPATAPALTAADPAAGTLERVVANGDVHFSQPGRSGSGEQLLYTAATEQFVLTGGADGRQQPRVMDAQQGSLTGATLVFGAGDKSVVVSGEGTNGKKGRVRTETTLE